MVMVGELEKKYLTALKNRSLPGNSMLQHAIKEWAVVCQALARGKQAVILRKGGIAEAYGEFKVEHKQFWLYPTYLHQKPDGIKPNAVPLFQGPLPHLPPSNKSPLSPFAS